jgi:hypothetical protein
LPIDIKSACALGPWWCVKGRPRAALICVPFGSTFAPQYSKVLIEHALGAEDDNEMGCATAKVWFSQAD